MKVILEIDEDSISNYYDSDEDFKTDIQNILFEEISLPISKIIIINSCFQK